MSDENTMETEEKKDYEYVLCAPNQNIHKSTNYSNKASEEKKGFDLAEFKKNLKIDIKSLNRERMEFDLIGIEAPIANALRRVMLSEVPTMAIENVFILENDSHIKDDVLAHRLGLIPIKADPKLFSYKNDEEKSDEKNSIIFELDITCKKKIVNGEEIYEHVNVLSSDLKWLPEGSKIPDDTNCHYTSNQKEILELKSNIRTVHDNILIAKLAHNQRIHCEAHCVKGIGKTHAKWSPVATAWYKLQPEIIILKEEFSMDDYLYLSNEFPNLFLYKTNENGIKKLTVNDVRNNTIHLEKLRKMCGEERWEGAFEIRKRKDHYIFTIESVGQYTPNEIFIEALNVLIKKFDKIYNNISLIDD